MAVRFDKLFSDGARFRVSMRRVCDLAIAWLNVARKLKKLKSDHSLGLGL